MGYRPYRPFNPRPRPVIGPGSRQAELEQAHYGRGGLGTMKGQQFSAPAFWRRVNTRLGRFTFTKYPPNPFFEYRDPRSLIIHAPKPRRTK